jgi:cysteine desulfurase
MKIYLDYNATTPMRPEALEAMRPHLGGEFGNPNSIHAWGREARRALEDARASVASAVGARDKGSIVFVSSGTEADNLALKGAAWAAFPDRRHIVTSAVEHHAVINTCRSLGEQGFEVTYLPVGGDGLIDLEHVERSLRPDTAVLSLMHANNETGVIFPIAEVGKLAARRGIVFHTDAVQTLGRLPIDVETLGVDLLSVSGHKVYGPKGIGALYIRPGTKMVAHLHGGRQERGRRAGTENVPGAVGLARAVELSLNAMAAEADRLRVLRDHLETGILGRIEGTKRNGHRDRRLPTTSNISFSGTDEESVILALDLEGIAVSAGAACTSGSLERSHVLEAMGRKPDVDGAAIRFSLGAGTTEAEIDHLLDLLPAVVGRIRAAAVAGRPEPALARR